MGCASARGRIVPAHGHRNVRAHHISLWRWRPLSARGMMSPRLCRFLRLVDPWIRACARRAFRSARILRKRRLGRAREDPFRRDRFCRGLQVGKTCTGRAPACRWGGCPPSKLFRALSANSLSCVRFRPTFSLKRGKALAESAHNCRRLAESAHNVSHPCCSDPREPRRYTAARISPGVSNT